MGVLENSGKHWAFQPKHRRQYLYVHSKLYYGIQCRKHFPSQCKWPAQYYSGKQTQKRKKENPASSSTLLPSLGLLKSTLRKTKDPHCSLHLYISLTTHPSFCWCSVEMGQPLIWPNYMKHDLISDVLFPAFTSHCPSLSMLKPSIHRLYSWFSEASKRCELMAERCAACLREGVCGGWGGWVRDVLWKESILYRLSAWLAGYSSGTASHFLSNCSIGSICRHQNDDKKKKKNTQRLNRKHHTQCDKKTTKKQVQSEVPNSLSTHIRPFPAMNHKNIQNKRFYLRFSIVVHWFNTDRVVIMMQTAKPDISNKANLL